MGPVCASPKEENYNLLSSNMKLKKGEETKKMRLGRFGQEGDPG